MTARRTLRRARHCLLVAVVALAPIGLWPTGTPPAYADHGGGVVYNNLWIPAPQNPDPEAVEYYVDDGFPKMNVTLDLIRSAAAEWSFAGTSDFDIDPGPSSALIVQDTRWMGEPCPLRGDVVFSYGDIDRSDPTDNKVGAAFPCFVKGTSDKIASGRVRVSDEWEPANNRGGVTPHFGAGQPDPNEFDVWSLLTHETGHITGRFGGNGNRMGHFGRLNPDGSLTRPLSEQWRACDTGPGTGQYSTMCALIPLGTTGLRTLSGHDKTALAAHYPS